MAIPSQRVRHQRRLRRPAKVTRARWAAWLTIRRTFDDDAWTDRAFAGVVEQLGLDDDPRERAFAQRLAYGAVQQAKRLDHVIAVLGKRPLTKIEPPVLHALRLGCHELLDLQQATDEDGRRLGSTSAHAAVSQAVELVRGAVGERAVAFTNAILRRAQVDGQSVLEALDPADDAELATLLSMPQWLVRCAIDDLGRDRAIAELRAMNSPHPAAFRNTSTGELLVVDGSTAHLVERVERGELVPQSLASQLVVRTLDPQPGERVLDMCAAPGGKATHIAQLIGPEGQLVAVELHEHRADSIRALAERVGVHDRLRVVVADATTLTPDLIGSEPFDRVLLDAPCSGTGVLAARPDARWKRSKEHIDELVALQRELLAAAATLVRLGGVVVYSTCSILAAEDEAIVAQLPANLVLDEAQRTWPSEGTDGFFVARLHRADGEAS